METLFQHTECFTLNLLLAVTKNYTVAVLRCTKLGFTMQRLSDIISITEPTTPLSNADQGGSFLFSRG